MPFPVTVARMSPDTASMATLRAWAYCWVNRKKMLPITIRVWRMVQTKPVTGRANQSLTRTFFSAIHSQPATTPSRIRQPRATHRAFTAPDSPVVLIKGEKAKAVRPGVKVLTTIEQMPNTPPKMAPAKGPRRIAPRMTGIWVVVALVMGRGIKPKGVLAMTMMMAASMATPTSQRVSFFRFFIFDYLLLPLLPKRMQRNI